MDRDTADIIAHNFDFAGMNPGADRNAMALHFASGCDGAVNGPRRSVKNGKQAIASTLYGPAAIASNFSSDNVVVIVEEITPGPIAYLRGARGRIHDIGKQHCGQDAIDFGNVSLPSHELLDLTHDGSRVPNPPKVIVTIKLGNPCTLNVTGKIAALFNVYGEVAGAMDH